MTEMTNNDPLSEMDRAIVAGRLARRPVTEIALSINRSTECVYRRLRTPAVRVALADARMEDVQPLLDQARNEVQSSITTLAAIRDNAQSATARIRACEAILGWWRSLLELCEILPRLAALEAATGSGAKENGDDAESWRGDGE